MNGTSQEGAIAPPLTAARLSALRHDLRTPFNQIIGYAEMVGEDAQDCGDEPLNELALAVVAAAHGTLTLLTDALAGAPEQVTPEHLAAVRVQVAEPLEALRESVAGLRVGVEGSSLVPAETVGNL